MNKKLLKLTSALTTLALCAGSVAPVGAASLNDRHLSLAGSRDNALSIGSESVYDKEPMAAYEGVIDHYVDGEVAYTYEETQEGQITLTGYTGKAEKLQIPESIDGKAVTAIGESCFAGDIHLKRVEVPEGVVSLGDYAFEACSVLEKVYLPDSLKTIGNGAFSGCAALTLADLQNDVESIGNGAFLYCTHLVEFRAPRNLTHLGNFVFAGCERLMYVDLSTADLKEIPDRAFYWCKQLSAFRTPYSLEKVGTRAFSHCQVLEKIWLPDTVNEMGAGAFEYCGKIESVSLSAAIVEPFTFEGCYALQNVSLSEEVKLIKQYAFASTNLTPEMVDIPEGTVVEEGAFGNPDAENDPENADEASVTDGSEEAAEVVVEEAAEEAIAEDKTNESTVNPEDCTTPQEIISAAREAGMLVMTNDDFQEWAEGYLQFNQENALLTSEENPYIYMYKKEEPDYYVAMTAAASMDPDAIAQASKRYGEDLVPMFQMVDHGLAAEVRRFKMEQDMLLYTGVYDSQLKAAAGTDHVPTLEELKACIGKTFTDPCLTSTTVDMEVSFHFSDTLFIIYARTENINRLGAVCMDAFLHTPENEIFVNPGAQYLIKDVGTLAATQKDDMGQESTVYKDYLLLELIN